MKKIISFSLYGNDRIYTLGAIRNAEIKQNIFLDWEMWVYHDESVDSEILNNLSLLGVKLIKTELSQSLGRFWRFLGISDDVDYCIFRDTDSRISERDEVATNEWIDSGKNFHIIREHPAGHAWAMNAGMWGCKKNAIDDINLLIKNYYNKNKNNLNKFSDQYFLGEIIYPMTIDNCLIHDEFCVMPNEIATHIKRDRKIDDFAFIGESVDENDIPRGDQRSPIKQRYV
jgi:hypothetical protein